MLTLLYFSFKSFVQHITSYQIKFLSLIIRGFIDKREVMERICRLINGFVTHNRNASCIFKKRRGCVWSVWRGLRCYRRFGGLDNCFAEAEYWLMRSLLPMYWPMRSFLLIYWPMRSLLLKYIDQWDACCICIDQWEACCLSIDQWDTAFRMTRPAAGQTGAQLGWTRPGISIH